MIRKDRDYWQRLRVDRRSSIATLLTAVAAVIAIVDLTVLLVPGTHYAARATPLYWLLIVPVAWWISELAGYEPWAVRSWKVVLALLCGVNAACFARSVVRGEVMVLEIVSFALVQCCAAASMIAYRGSLVAREGPAR
ncbi:hypothetical protein ACBY01_03580 [Sphingomonas sp. ac-8]|uniref:hypothetical protein n=1 Tax=Sphingomonas sp. ac-8 TaxID=3242977 RepID=UPI003A7FF06B